jgi:hypothetical protein
MRFKKIREIDWLLVMPCNSLTNFECEAHAMTRNVNQDSFCRYFMPKKIVSSPQENLFLASFGLGSHCGSIGSKGAPHSALRHAIVCSLAGNSEQHYIAYCCTERRSGDTFLVSCACQSLHCSQPRRLHTTLCTTYYILLLP